ncbi:MAG: hypothetical protein JST82_09410 [Bacteroidetes bacterium]|nr:hypothetical protein [Bacteroidota bacterium]
MRTKNTKRKKNNYHLFDNGANESKVDHPISKVDMDIVYKSLEEAKATFSRAEQKLFSAQAICNELYKNSDPYKVQRIRQWDNRGEDDV